MSATTSGPVDTVGVRELKSKLSSYLDRVQRGEEITITEHGRPIARLTSVTPGVSEMAALVEAGIVRPARSRHRELPKTRVKLAPGPSVADVVADQRD